MCNSRVSKVPGSHEFPVLWKPGSEHLAGTLETHLLKAKNFPVSKVPGSSESPFSKVLWKPGSSLPLANVQLPGYQSTVPGSHF